MIKKFSELGIEAPKDVFIGTKKQVEDILNEVIIVHAFKIKDSKHKPGEKCLHLQFQLAEKKHVVFTGSNVLMDTIAKIPKEAFPFSTKIVKEHKALKFT